MLMKVVTLNPAHITYHRACAYNLTYRHIYIHISLRLPKCCNISPRNIHERFKTLLTPVLTIFTDFLSAVVTSEIAQIFFSLRWRVFSSEVAKLKWFCFDLALKLALYTYKKKKKKRKHKSSHNTVCVTYKAK